MAWADWVGSSFRWYFKSSFQVTHSGEGHHFLLKGKRVCRGQQTLGRLAVKCVTVFGGLVASPYEAAWLASMKHQDVYTLICIYHVPSLSMTVRCGFLFRMAQFHIFCSLPVNGSRVSLGFLGSKSWHRGSRARCFRGRWSPSARLGAWASEAGMGDSQGCR